MTKRWIVLCGCTAIVAGGALALAVTGPYGTPPRVIAYGGTLEQNGMPVNGAVPMTFFIVDSEAAPVTSALWSEDYPAGSPVTVAGGRFQVGLGSRTPNTGIPDSVLQAGELYVAVRVAGVDLAGRQRLLASPFAITAAQARDFTVNGNLTVTGGVSLPVGALTDNSVLGADLAPGALQVIGPSQATDSYAGPATVALGSATRRICYLTSTSHEGGDNCTGGCAVEVVGGNWQVRAIGTECGAGGTARALCRANCITW